MTLTIDITAELESRVREEAAKQGLAPQEYIVKSLREHLQHMQTLPPPCLPKEESYLLQKINQGLPQETWQRYHELLEKRRAETLTPEEHAALMALSDQIEASNGRRIEHLVKLARLRRISLTDVMEQLGINAPSYG